MCARHFSVRQECDLAGHFLKHVLWDINRVPFCWGQGFRVKISLGDTGLGRVKQIYSLKDFSEPLICQYTSGFPRSGDEYGVRGEFILGPEDTKIFSCSVLYIKWRTYAHPSHIHHTR
jgi:hypothetical protein